MKNTFFTKMLASALVMFLGFEGVLFSQGNILITPMRVVFEDNNNKMEVSLVNIGNDTTTYAISFINYKMTEDGQFIELKEAERGINFSDKYIRVYPRTVTLAPNEPQSVRLQLRKNSDLAVGEYRSHLYFRALKDVKPLGQEIAVDSAKMMIKLNTIFGISIPVIFRVGQTNSATIIKEANVLSNDDGTKSLFINFGYSGNQSTYGEIRAIYYPLQGDPVQVAYAKGIAIYPPLTERNITLKLENTERVNLSSGKILITFSDQAADANKKLFAQKEIQMR